MLIQFIEETGGKYTVYSYVDFSSLGILYWKKKKNKNEHTHKHFFIND